MQKVSGLVSELKSVTLKKSTLTDDIARELYEARKELDSRGFNKGKENVPNGTFSQYLNDCGLARTTVYNWLEHYEPEAQLAARGRNQYRPCNKCYKPKKLETCIAMV